VCSHQEPTVEWVGNGKQLHEFPCFKLVLPLGIHE